MGCCGGDREKQIALKNDVKWEYVVCVPLHSERTRL